MGDTTPIVSVRTLFQEKLKMISEIMDEGRKNTKIRRILRSTLKDMTPVMLEIEQYNEHLNPPSEEIKTLIKEIDAGDEEELVCFRDDSLAADVDLQAMARDNKETLYKVREILEVLSKEKFIGVGALIRSPYGVPKNPDFTVGFDVPLSKLKMEVLKDGMSILLLTGLGGSGKTTLATKLCWDEQVKGKFRENIFFSTFSKTPNLKIIVERLFEQCGHRVTGFQSDEDAINQLGLLLSKLTEGSPLLLVLDDVRPGSEILVEKFKFQISDYKILVTSRVAFPRFGTPYILKPLVHEDAMILFRHYAHLEESISSIPIEEIVQKVVRSCKGLPIPIQVIG